MVKKKKRKTKKKIRSKISRKVIHPTHPIKRDKTGLYIWIVFFIIGGLLFNFFEQGWPIFGGIILLAIIFRLLRSGSSGLGL